MVGSIYGGVVIKTTQELPVPGTTTAVAVSRVMYTAIHFVATTEEQARNLIIAGALKAKAVTEEDLASTVSPVEVKIGKYFGS